MPRIIISKVEKRQWMEEYDGGKLQGEMAKDFKRDIRTIKKGIEEARRERDIKFARIELLKEALRKHNTDMLTLMEQLAVVFQPLPSNQPIPWRNFDVGTLPFPGGEVQYEIGTVTAVSGVALDIEANVRWKLLKEHLKCDPLTNALNIWRKTLPYHMLARVELKRKLVALLKSKTGYKVEDESASDRCLLVSGVDHLFRYLLTNLPNPVAIDKIANSIAVDSDMCQVKYGAGTTLACARGEEEGCRNNILEVLKELSTKEAMGTVISTYEAHRASIDKASKAIKEIRMMGFIPGQCRICRRLGR